MSTLNNIVQPILEIPKTFYLGLTGGIEVTFIDSHVTKYVTFHKRNPTFKIGGKENTKRYNINYNMIVKRKLYYMSDCAEPVKIEMDLNKCVYYVDSKEFATTYENKLTRAFFLTQEQQMLTIILIVSGLNMLNNILFMNGINVLGFMSGSGGN